MKKLNFLLVYDEISVNPIQQACNLHDTFAANLPYGDFGVGVIFLQSCYELAVLSFWTNYKFADFQSKTSAILLQTKIAI